MASPEEADRPKEAVAELAIIPSESFVMAEDKENVPMLISVKPPLGVERTPSDICCVIDISWSMSMEAFIGTESNGLSLMDIAKHAVRTIIHTLTEQDRLSLVTFCERAKTILDLTPMDDAGKAAADAQVEAIGFGSGTALWQGISHGLENLMLQPADGRLRHIMLLTDGETVDCAHVVSNLQAFRTKHGGLPGTINAFGFGYEIDSPLLTQVAEVGDGSYAFIPDAGFVGTVFVNSMSNLLCTIAKDVTLTLTPQEGATITQVAGQWEPQRTADEGVILKLGTFQCGQSKDIVVAMSTKAEAKSYVSAALEYATRHGNHSVAAEGKLPVAEDGPLVEMHRCRCEFVDAIAKACAMATCKADADDANVKSAHEFIQEVAVKLKESPLAAADGPVSALLDDLLGQSSEALSRADWYRKWGRHYLPSIKMAHKMQLCNNFKDPGVQHYGGKLFSEIRDFADDAFCTLAAPKPTPAMYRYHGGGKLLHNPNYVDPSRPARPSISEASRPAPAPVSMAAYHDAYAG